MKSSLSILLVAAGGALGALTRYGLTIINRPGLPAGTLLVNVVGCLIMGLLLRGVEVGVAKPELRLALGLGFLGALTTFSTFSGEILTFLLERNYLPAIVYMCISVGGSVAAVTLGYLVGQLLWR